MNGYLAPFALVGLIACGGSRSAGPNSSHDPGTVPMLGPTDRTFVVATVENYPNGLSLVQHPLGDSAAAKLRSAGWSGTRFEDEEVIPPLFTGRLEFPDLLVFGGHGTHFGPSLTTDPDRTMIPENYFWGLSASRPLRWFFNDSCLGLNDGVDSPEDSPRWERVPDSYWYLDVWLQAMDWGRGGMHAYLGHRGSAWANQTNTGSAYAIARSLQGESIGQAWFEAAALDMALGQPGILPAVMSAFQPETGKDWFDESLATPWDDPRLNRESVAPVPGSHEHLAYHYAVIGTPEFSAGLVRGGPPGNRLTGAAPSGLDLSALPHRVTAGGELVDIGMEGQGMDREAFLASSGLAAPTFELLHFVQRGAGKPVLAGRLVPLRSGDGKALVLRCDAQGRVLRIILQP